MGRPPRAAGQLPAAGWPAGRVAELAARPRCAGTPATVDRAASPRRAAAGCRSWCRQGRRAARAQGAVGLRRCPAGASVGVIGPSRSRCRAFDVGLGPGRAAAGPLRRDGRRTRLGRRRRVRRTAPIVPRGADGALTARVHWWVRRRQRRRRRAVWRPSTPVRLPIS